MIFIIKKSDVNIFAYPKAVTKSALNMQKKKYNYLMKFLDYLLHKRKA